MKTQHILHHHVAIKMAILAYLPCLGKVMWSSSTVVLCAEDNWHVLWRSTNLPAIPPARVELDPLLRRPRIPRHGMAMDAIPAGWGTPNHPSS